MSHILCQIRCFSRVLHYPLISKFYCLYCEFLECFFILLINGRLHLLRHIRRNSLSIFPKREKSFTIINRLFLLCRTSSIPKITKIEMRRMTHIQALPLESLIWYLRILNGPPSWNICWSGRKIPICKIYEFWILLHFYLSFTFNKIIQFIGQTKES